MTTGRCLCGDVRFEIEGKTGPLAYCHCESCRRASGTAFGANADVRVSEMRWLAGREAIREFESSPGKMRAFCPRCGSPIYSRQVAVPEIVRIRFGLLDGDPERRPVCHAFVGEKAPWYEIADDVPQFTAVPGAPSDGA